VAIDKVNIRLVVSPLDIQAVPETSGQVLIQDNRSFEYVAIGSGNLSRGLHVDRLLSNTTPHSIRGVDVLVPTQPYVGHGYEHEATRRKLNRSTSR